MNFVGHISLFWVYVRRMIVRCRKWDDRPSKRETVYVRCRKWDDRPRNIVLPPSTNLVNGFVHERLPYYAYRAHTITVLFITPSFGILIHQLLRSSPPAWHPFISYPPPSSSSSAWHEAKTNGAAAVEVLRQRRPQFQMPRPLCVMAQPLCSPKRHPEPPRPPGSEVELLGLTATQSCSGKAGTCEVAAWGKGSDEGEQSILTIGTMMNTQMWMNVQG
jgi:hypothetical protein